MQATLDTEVVRNETFSRMHEQLRRSLHAAGHDTSELRGLLVLQTYDEVGWGTGKNEYFPPLGVASLDADTLRQRLVWTDESLELRIHVAIALSLIFSILSGLVRWPGPGGAGTLGPGARGQGPGAGGAG